MSIWLWVVVFLTWCAFVWVVTSLRQFRVLVMKNERLDWELRHAKKRLLKTENARMSAESYITEQSEALNEWVEAYGEQGELLDDTLDMFEEWQDLDIPRRKYDSFKEIDDLLVQSTTKEFIRLTAWKRASEEKAKQPVVSLNVHKDIRNAVEDIADSFKKIKFYFSDEGYEDIENLIEQEKLKFLNEKERSTSVS